MSTLLILGAGTDQIYPIKLAKQLGLRVLACDINPNAPGFLYADEVANVSNRDLGGLKALCDSSLQRGYPINGVLVMGVDIPHIAAELSDYLCVPGPTIETGRLTTNKFLMKKCLSEAGVRVPWFSLVESSDHLYDLMAHHGAGKFVLKPTDRSGARGVVQISRNDSNLDEIFNQVKGESLIGQVQLEEFIPGPQFSTESIIYQGKAFTPGFVDRNYEMLDRFKPYFIENGGNHPASASTSLRQKVEDLVESAASALGIVNGVAKGDVVISQDGEPMLIELAARLSGGDFSESLIPLGTGVNIVKSAIDLSLGNDLDIEALSEKHVKFIANRYFFSSPGLLREIKGLDEAMSKPWLHKIEVMVSVGDVISDIQNHASRLGVFIVEGSNRVELEDRINTIYNLVSFDVESI